MEFAKVKRPYPLRILMKFRQGCWSMHVVFWNIGEGREKKGFEGMKRSDLV